MSGHLDSIEERNEHLASDINSTQAELNIQKDLAFYVLNWYFNTWELKGNVLTAH